MSSTCTRRVSPRLHSTAIGPVRMWHTGPARSRGDARPDRTDAVVHQQVGRITGVVGDRFDLDDVATSHRQARRLVTVDVAPVHGVRRRREATSGGRVVRQVVGSGGRERGPTAWCRTYGCVVNASFPDEDERVHLSQHPAPWTTGEMLFSASPSCPGRAREEMREPEPPLRYPRPGMRGRPARRPRPSSRWRGGGATRPLRPSACTLTSRRAARAAARRGTRSSIRLSSAPIARSKAMTSSAGTREVVVAPDHEREVRAQVVDRRRCRAG